MQRADGVAGVVANGNALSDMASFFKRGKGCALEGETSGRLLVELLLLGGADADSARILAAGLIPQNADARKRMLSGIVRLVVSGIVVMNVVIVSIHGVYRLGLPLL